MLAEEGEKMQEEPSQTPHEAATTFQDMTGYLSIKETARVLGVSERSVYGYIETGKLPGARVDNLIVAVSEYVYAFKRRAPGRVRTVSPRWRIPPLNNDQYMTLI